MITHILAFLGGIGAGAILFHVPLSSAVATLRADMAALKSKLESFTKK